MARCPLCNDLEKHRESQPRLGFDFTPAQLVQSASEGGCESCLVILEGLQQARSLSGCSLTRDIRSIYALCHNQRGSSCDSLSLEVYFFDDRPRVELEFNTVGKQTWKAILPRPSVSKHPLSQQGLKWIRTQMEACESNHTACADADKNRLPKRVLSVLTDTGGSVSVRLVEKSADHQYITSGPYVALSHVWGEERVCITTKDNLEARKQGIPWEDLPKTFRDAIEVTVNLNIPFVWIDSLCIIQDDLKDWEVESARMADTYENATLTLAATTSLSDVSGCFPKDGYLGAGIDLELPDTVSAGRISVRRPLKHWVANVPSQVKASFPLLSRGWVFQERLLSPRVLHLCEQELVWECQNSCICECGGLDDTSTPSGNFQDAINSNKSITDRTSEWRQLVVRKRQILYPPLPDSNLSAAEQLGHSQIAEREAKQQAMSGLVDHFHQFVEQYSALQLSKPTDRLPALSGICGRMQTFRGDHLVGLWSDSICADLMWRNNTPGFRAQPAPGHQRTRSSLLSPSEYRGPSWSWASIEGAVSYWYDLPDSKVRRIHKDRRIKRPGWITDLQWESTQRAEKANKEWKPGDEEGEGKDWGRPELVTENWVDEYGEIDEEEQEEQEELERENEEDEEFVFAVPLGRNRASIRYRVENSGLNPFGAVKFASLAVVASAIEVEVSLEEEHRSPDNYHLVIEIPEVKHAPAYPIRFYPDHPLTLPVKFKKLTGNEPPARYEVVLLLVHQEVCLVLQQKHKNYNLWKRIGIVRLPEILLQFYKVEWMRESRRRQFLIV
ncbi:heterokaryon incompatibility protein-domain-containing protein [Lophiotrema nucula]|uniref:Heterokaryon incompatibility protein-domain-containing protein n=1 Tax=Lophiotrema nucula TaxID=690887 RepID=A0A6A5Z0F3_9PLEO|nr:heterokaryon incompatibility protein-domain-containing protein [Lophiotrema nucula]